MISVLGLIFKIYDSITNTVVNLTGSSFLHFKFYKVIKNIEKYTKMLNLIEIII